MIQLGDTILSTDIFEKDFVCNLSKCKGECCVSGDSGAPLDADEVQILEDIFDQVKPFLRPEGVAAIKKQGTSIKDWDGEFVTPLVAGKECAYVIFDENRITKCGIEKAWEQGAVSYRKPISCQLYPIRVTRYSSFEAINYHKWDICSPACELGKELKVPVYKFLKDPLTRKYGQVWYGELEEVATAYYASKKH